MAPVFVFLAISFLFFGTVLGVIGGAFWVASRATKRQDGVWWSVAQHFGLQMVGRQIHGWLHGQRVRVYTVTRGGGSNSRRTYTIVSADFPMALDLGLNIRRHGFMNDMFNQSGDILLGGDRRFDDMFIVSADEADRVRRLITPKARHLLTTQIGAATFSLNDQGMRVECSGRTTSVPWLTWALETCARVAAEAQSAVDHVPPAGPLRGHREAWHAYATANGLRGRDTPLAMWGKLDGTAVRASAIRVGRHAYEMEVAVDLRRPLQAGLELRPCLAMDRVAVFFGGQDHRFGDPMFDDAFRVKAADPDRCGDLLNEPMRRELLLLQQRLGPVMLNDNQLTVRMKHVPQHPSAMPLTVQRMVGVIEHLDRRERNVGPYR